MDEDASRSRHGLSRYSSGTGPPRELHDVMPHPAPTEHTVAGRAGRPSIFSDLRLVHPGNIPWYSVRICTASISQAFKMTTSISGRFHMLIMSAISCERFMRALAPSRVRRTPRSRSLSGRLMQLRHSLSEEHAFQCTSRPSYSLLIWQLQPLLQV